MRARSAAWSITHDGTGPHFVYSVHARNIHLSHQLGDNSDATDDDTDHSAHRLCQPKCLADNDDNSYDGIALQLRKRTAARTHYDDDGGRTSKARKAEKDASAASTSKGKGRF